MALNIVNERLVNDWNEKYKKGTEVKYFNNDDHPEEYEIAYTRSKAILSWTPYPVICLTNHARAVSLLRIEPIEKK
jgi:hypothetical protein